jgi:hypothetical protein
VPPWTVNTVVPFMYFNVSCSIDDSQKNLYTARKQSSFNSTAQGTAYHFEYVIFPPITTNTAINIDISTLTSCAHKLTVFAEGEYNVNNDVIFPYSYQSSPIYFSVNYLATYPTASPSPTPSIGLLTSTPIPSSIPSQTSNPTPTTPYLPPNDRNAPHLDPTFYLLPICVIIAIIVIAIIIYRRGRLASKQSFL